MSRKKKVFLVVAAAIVGLVAAVAIPMWLRGRANDALAKELHAEFDAWLASIPKIPDSENGALVILQGLDLLEEFPQHPDYPEEWSVEREKDAEILREYLSRNEKALRSIEKSLEFEKWQYPIDYSKGYAAEVPHFEAIIWATNAFLLKGDFARLEGRNAEAVSYYLRTLRLGVTLSSGKLLLSRVLEIAVYSRTYARLIPFLSKGSLAEADLTGVREQLTSLYATRGDIIGAIEGDMLSLFKPIAEGIEEGYSMWRTWERLFGKETDEGKGYGFPPGKWWYDLESDVAACREFLKMCRNIHPARYYAMPEELKNIGLLRKKFASTLTKSKAGEMIMYPTLSDILIPVPAVNLKKFAINETFWRAAIIMTAVRLFEARNGRLPEKLDELGELVRKGLLIDPFSGKHLVYRLKDGDFCLYSVGLDGVDSKCEDTRELFQIKAHEGEPDDIIFHTPAASGRDSSK